MRILIDTYFKFFSSKDINSLKKMFSNEIILKDWEINAVGINQVVEANKKIFNSVNSIEISIIEYFEFNKNRICLIDILINKKETIKAPGIICIILIGICKPNKSTHLTIIPPIDLSIFVIRLYGRTLPGTLGSHMSQVHAHC